MSSAAMTPASVILLCVLLARQKIKSGLVGADAGGHTRERVLPPTLPPFEWQKKTYVTPVYAYIVFIAINNSQNYW